jgi:hypothetical protein
MSNTLEQTRLERLLNRPRIVAGLYLLLAVLMTWPLAADFAGSVAGGAGDLWQNYWNFWWWKTALLDLGQHPYFSPMIFHPTGAKLIFHTHSPFNMLVALPLTATLGPAAAYNFCILLALWVSGLGMYLLVRELSSEARGAFLAGIVFAFFPQTIEQILEHLNLAAVQFMPLTLFFFVRLNRVGGVGNVGRTGLFFALNALCSWHLGLTLILALAPMALLDFVRRSRPRHLLLRDWTLAGLFSLLLVLPLLAPMVAEMATIEDDYYRKPAEAKGIEAPFLFIPHYGHSLWGDTASTAYIDQAYRSPGYVAYLGFVPLGLALFALLRRRPGAIYWAAFALGATVLALGRHPFWDHKVLENITLPFYLLEQLPVFDLLRLANRFLILAGIGLAVLAGLGWAGFRNKADWKVCLLSLAILVEYAWLPFPTRPVETSPLHAQLAGTAEDGAIFNIPSNQRSRSWQNLVAQTVHGRTINDGYVSTIAPRAQSFIDGDPALSDLTGIPKLENPVDAARLKSLGFEFVVIHKRRLDSYKALIQATADPGDIVDRRRVSRFGGIPDEKYERMRADLTSACGDPHLEDNWVVVFALDGCPED